MRKINASILKKILKSECSEYDYPSEITTHYKLLYSKKDDAEYKEQIQKKLDDLALCLYNQLEKSEFYLIDNYFIEGLNLDPVVHSDLINFIIKKHSEAPKKPNNI